MGRLRLGREHLLREASGGAAIRHRPAKKCAGRNQPYAVRGLLVGKRGCPAVFVR